MTIEQLKYYQEKLSFEMDSADLASALTANASIIIVDARAKDNFENEHIPGAINLPHKEICFNSTVKLDKNITYVCYCDGIGCNASTKGALKLMTLGFAVKELIGGIDWWKRDGYSTAGLKATKGVDVQCGC